MSFKKGTRSDSTMNRDSGIFKNESETRREPGGFFKSVRNTGTQSIFKNSEAELTPNGVFKNSEYELTPPGFFKKILNYLFCRFSYTSRNKSSNNNTPSTYNKITTTIINTPIRNSNSFYKTSISHTNISHKESIILNQPRKSIFCFKTIDNKIDSSNLIEYFKNLNFNYLVDEYFKFNNIIVNTKFDYIKNKMCITISINYISNNNDKYYGYVCKTFNNYYNETISIKDVKKYTTLLFF
jgi:hypothetical protein